VIARRLGIADSTVKIHMRAIFQALEVKSRSQAAIAASRLDKVLNQKIRAALHGETPIGELLSSMSKRSFKRNQLLFRKGDPSQEIYYVSRGTIHLEEIGADLGPGNLLGEIGLFTPNGQRTCTARCKTDAELLVIPAERALQIYCQDPEFAVYVTHLLAARLMADKARLEAA
jgi:signal-transduction protein with cAMP-binding, CBS, and nucleotidyltransferase domain